VLSTQAWYTSIVVLMVGMRLCQTLIAGRVRAVSADPLVGFNIQGEVAGDSRVEVREVLDDFEYEVTDGNA